MTTNMLTTFATLAVILSKEEQIQLVSRFQADRNPDDLAALISSNVRLAHTVARKHNRNGIDFNDLLAQATEGIIIAADKFDPTKGASFTTYARMWMTAKCQEFVQANAGIVHCGSRTAKRLWSGLQKARKAIGQDATAPELAAHMGLDVTDVEACLRFMATRGSSLDTPINDSGATVATVVPSGRMRQDVALERTQHNERIVTALGSFIEGLNDRQADIFRGRIANDIIGEDKRDANSFGVSKQRVGQIEKDLRGKLRAHFTRVLGNDGVAEVLRATF